MVPTLTDYIVRQNNEDFDEEFEFYIGETNTPDDFTSCTFVGGMKNEAGQGTAMSSTDGTIAVTQPNILKFNVDYTVMQTLPPGIYDFDIRVTRPGGINKILVRGKVKLDQGIAT